VAFPSIVHSRVVDNAATSNLTLANNWVQSPGNLWVVGMNWDNSTILNKNAGPTMPGFTFKKVVANHVNAGAFLEIWVPELNNAPSMPAGASGAFTVTCAMSGSCALEIYILDIAPPAPGIALVLDLSPPIFQNGTSGSTISCGPMIGLYPNELFIGYEADISASATGAGTGWTADTNSPSNFGIVFEWQTQVKAGARVTATTPLSGGGTGWTQALFGIAAAPVPRARALPLGL
jgi:hypothetical protein